MIPGWRFNRAPAPKGYKPGRWHIGNRRAVCGMTMSDHEDTSTVEWAAWPDLGAVAEEADILCRTCARLVVNMADWI